LGKHSRRLQELYLASCFGVSDEGMQAVLKGCSELEELDISRCYLVSDDSLKLAVVYLNRLSFVRLTGCLKVYKYVVYMCMRCVHTCVLCIRVCCVYMCVCVCCLCVCVVYICVCCVYVCACVVCACVRACVRAYSAYAAEVGNPTMLLRAIYACNLIGSFGICRFFVVIVKFYLYNPPIKFAKHLESVLDNAIAQSQVGISSILHCKVPAKGFNNVFLLYLSVKRHAKPSTTVETLNFIY